MGLKGPRFFRGYGGRGRIGVFVGGESGKGMLRNMVKERRFVSLDKDNFMILLLF